MGTLQQRPQYEELFGKLYNWYTVVDPRNVCPTGWHVPTLAEWNTLTDYLGGLSVAGGKMKSTAPEWQSPNGEATNESGFSALPSGSRAASSNGDFVTHGFFSRYWSTTEDSPTGAYGSGADYLFGSTGDGPFYKLDGNSVRCLRD
ncbi:MAG: fibrobacter succinogenes major paralogous domain-containing protein [Flavobacteriales bacterium]|nr:fibrobacter succinogenes major paralogous domain-containing protein [Flavobacteriales bacterium]